MTSPMCEQMFCLFPGFHPRRLAPSAQPARTQSWKLVTMINMINMSITKDFKRYFSN